MIYDDDDIIMQIINNLAGPDNPAGPDKPYIIPKTEDIVRIITDTLFAMKPDISIKDGIIEEKSKEISKIKSEVKTRMLWKRAIGYSKLQVLENKLKESKELYEEESSQLEIDSDNIYNYNFYDIEDFKSIVSTLDNYKLDEFIEMCLIDKVIKEEIIKYINLT